MGIHQHLTGAQRTARYREGLRARGLRPRQIWLPDVRDPEMVAKIRADAAALATQAQRWNGVRGEIEALQDDLWDGHPPAAAQYLDGDEGDAAR